VTPTRRRTAPRTEMIGAHLGGGRPRSDSPGGSICCMSAASELRQRVAGLRSRLNALLERKERASSVQSFARARQDAHVTHHSADKMAQFASDETGGDAEIGDLRREIVSVEDELERVHGTGWRAVMGRALDSLRRS
jgi:hypothetical protein